MRPVRRFAVRAAGVSFKERPLASFPYSFPRDIGGFSLDPSALSRFLTPVIRLGVTGLARSGKTVFITALVNALCRAGASPPFSRLAGVPGFYAYIEPQPDDDVPRFAIEDHMAALTGDERSWPSSTRHVSQLRLTLAWDEPDPLRRFRRFDLSQRLHIDIVDYPGELLTDIGMLDQSYGQWARRLMTVVRSDALSAVSGPFLAFVDGLPRDKAVDEACAIEGAQIFTKLLTEAREKTRAGHVLGPGRFLMPGDLAGTPLLTFFPFDGAGSATGILERRFESYKGSVVKPFFERYFAKLDRQIVLVDVLGALNGGADALRELESGLENVLRAFRPGRNTWLSKLMRRRIDRIVFAATKADHIHAASRLQLRNVLEKSVTRAAVRAEEAGASYRCLAMSALRATQDVETTFGDETYRCVRGVLSNGETVSGTRYDGFTEGVVFPGDLPGKALDAFDVSYAGAQQFSFAKFRPPILTERSDGEAQSWPHINLDAAFEFLLGDVLP